MPGVKYIDLVSPALFPGCGAPPLLRARVPCHHGDGPVLPHVNHLLLRRPKRYLPGTPLCGESTVPLVTPWCGRPVQHTKKATARVCGVSLSLKDTIDMLPGDEEY